MSHTVRFWTGTKPARAVAQLLNDAGFAATAPDADHVHVQGEAVTSREAIRNEIISAVPLLDWLF